MQPLAKIPYGIPNIERLQECKQEDSLLRQEGDLVPVDNPITIDDLRNSSGYSYKTISEGFKSVGATTLIVGTVVFLAPGLNALRNGSIVANGVLSKAAKVVKYSFGFFFPIFSGGFKNIIISSASLAAFEYFVHVPFDEGFDAWAKKIQEAIKKQPLIPLSFHEDPILQANICPITLAPVRFPVRDRRTPQATFEQAALLAWLENNSTNPLTRQHLTINHLYFDQNLHEQIDRRLILLDFRKQMMECNQ